MPLIEIVCDARGSQDVVSALRAAGVDGEIKTLVRSPDCTITVEHDDPQTVLDDARVRHAIARARRA